MPKVNAQEKWGIIYANPWKTQFVGDAACRLQERP
jgi:hypothetical protein